MTHEIPKLLDQQRAKLEALIKHKEKDDKHSEIQTRPISVASLFGNRDCSDYRAR